ncbi:hypothetical protein NPS74_21790, partial [Cutibacterium acnes subsp. acnes]|nr:hypothetical protein [Cutibacterium acnes subsp. acnes]
AAGNQIKQKLSNQHRKTNIKKKKQQNPTNNWDKKQKTPKTPKIFFFFFFFLEGFFHCFPCWSALEPYRLTATSTTPVTPNIHPQPPQYQG